MLNTACQVAFCFCRERCENMHKILMITYLGILAAMAPLATDMYLPSLPELQADFGSSTALIQLTLTMTTLGMAIGQIFAGPISDLRGRKLPLFVGMFVFMAASITCALVDNIYIFLAARLVQGLAGACGIVIARAIARDMCEGAELTTFYAILMMVNGMAPILAPVLGGQLLRIDSWHLIFVSLAGVGLMMAVATLFYKETLAPEKRIRNISATLHVLPQLLKDKYFMGHCLVQGFVFMSFFTYIGSSSFIFQGIYGVSAQEFSYIFGGIGICMMMSGMIPAKLGGRMPESRMLFASIAMQIAAVMLLLGVFATVNNFWLVLVLLALAAAPIPVIGAVGFSMGLNGQGRNAGSASALLGFFSMFFGALMMPVAGYIGTDTGIPMGIIMLIGFLLAMLCYWTMVRPAHQN